MKNGKLELVTDTLLKVDWAKLFVTFARLFIYSIGFSVILATMFENGWMLGQGNTNYNMSHKEFWNFQHFVFCFIFFGDLILDILAVVISPMHTHVFKYYRTGRIFN